MQNGEWRHYDGIIGAFTSENFRIAYQIYDKLVINHINEFYIVIKYYFYIGWKLKPSKNIKSRMNLSLI